MSYFKSQAQLDKYVKDRKFPEKSIYYGKTVEQANIIKDNPELIKLDEDKQKLIEAQSLLPEHLQDGLQSQIDILDKEINKTINPFGEYEKLSDVPFDELSNYASKGFGINDQYDLNELEELSTDELIQVGQADNLDFPVLRKILDLTKEKGNPAKLDLVLEKNAHRMHQELIHEYLDELPDYINSEDFDYNKVSDIEKNGGCSKFKQALASHRYTNAKILEQLSKEKGDDIGTLNIKEMVAQNPNTSNETLNYLIGEEYSDTTRIKAVRNLSENGFRRLENQINNKEISSSEYDKKREELNILLNSFSNDKQGHIRKSCLNADYLTKETVDNFIKNNNEKDLISLANTSFYKDDYLYNQLYKTKNEKVLEAMADNQSLNYKVLEKMAYRSPNLPNEIKEKAKLSLKGIRKNSR